MIPFFLLVMVTWKVWHRTVWRRLEDIDLIGETPLIDAYERRYEEDKAERKAQQADGPVRRRGRKFLDAVGVVFW